MIDDQEPQRVAVELNTQDYRQTFDSQEEQNLIDI